MLLITISHTFVNNCNGSIFDALTDNINLSMSDVLYPPVTSLFGVGLTTVLKFASIFGMLFSQMT